ncbi:MULTISPECIES: acetate/propionate family kinase [Micrococcaceae]|uniref:Acetate kinase n=2 Tax=Arthrobacter rhombi TaxID=71253 RepID=A0A1R4G234_9MICC|nr:MULTISPECIES: acetate kinase [Micrococcaceae]PCC25090.1 acetate kinase [Glutamicibacter sp. BW78]SJM62234.1 Acetate kinase [Arthrobacter rhombi]
MLVLVINSGSSSLKYQVRETGTDEILLAGLVERIGGPEVPDHAAALETVQEHLHGVLGERQIEAVGHRVVHGGERFAEPVLITHEIVRAIERLAPLAPLHNPAAALGIRALLEKWPKLPQVAVFDTAFHRTMPEYAWRYAVPDDLYKRHGVRRYGFHGTSHDYVAGKAAELLGIERQRFRAVIAHLGNGASITAIRQGKSIDTSMGYTPLEGLVMGTRSGDLDASIVTQLVIRGEYTAEQMDHILNQDSGLKGLSGENDMRSVVETASQGDDGAELALEVAAYRLQKYIGGYHVAVGGAQAIVFTAGIGENGWLFRQRVVGGLGALGVKLDEMSNVERSKQPRVISAPESAIPVLVVPTDEESEIAAQTAALATAQQ